MSSENQLERDIIKICDKCKKNEASYYIDELKEWICEDCAKIEEERNKMAQKIEKKYSKRVYSYDVSELLACLSKDEVYNIARNLGLAKISNLKKEELVKSLLENYEVLINARLGLFDDTRFKFLLNYLNKKGLVFFEDISEEEADKSAYFIQQGFLYPTLKDGVPVLVMPEIVQNILTEYDNLNNRRILKENTEVLDIFRGMNKAYGVVSFELLNKILSNLNVKVRDNFDVCEFIKEAGYFYYEYREESKKFINSLVINLDNLEDEINKANVEDYQFIPKEELITMSKDDYFMNLKSGKSLIKEFNSVFKSNSNMIVDIMNEVSVELQENDVDKSINLVIEAMEVDDDIQKILFDMLKKFAGKVRLWKYKGRSLNDYNKALASAKKAVTVGRNDPCICGSGKKFKVCCGRK